jgi:hypothetical protein
MQPEERLSDAARDELARSLIDSDYAAARMRFVTDIRGLIINIEDWLAIDSWLGGVFEQANPGARPRHAVMFSRTSSHVGTDKTRCPVDEGRALGTRDWG